MKCTAPCVPLCVNEATTKLLSLSSAVTDEHIAPLRFLKVGRLDPEYKKEPLVDPTNLET